MIKIETLHLSPYDMAMEGMRNPMNSWDKNDSDMFEIGPNDLKLAKSLALKGPVHAKYRRMIIVWANVTAPLYWWKEFDTYKVGTVANSCSTMHKIAEKEFTLGDFSCEHLLGVGETKIGEWVPISVLDTIIDVLNQYREKYLATKDKKYWWQLIQLLPSSYNQKRTVMLSYENLAHMYADRKGHKLDEWGYWCAWTEELDYAKEIIFPIANEEEEK